MSFRRVQSRSVSLLEAGANVLVGYLVALLAQQLIFPPFGIHTTLARRLEIWARPHQNRRGIMRGQEVAGSSMWAN